MEVEYCHGYGIAEWTRQRDAPKMFTNRTVDSQDH